MKKTLIVISVIVVILALGVGIYYFNNFLNQPSEEEIAAAQEQIEKEFTTSENDMPDDEKLDLNKTFSDDMPEHRIQSIIHSMSHQKVKAEQKWGQYQITQERVARLLEVAKLNRDTYGEGEHYVNILTKLSTGDFSNAVLDHNFIWSLQGGNIGEATDLMTSVEEQKYIEQYFKNNEENN